MIQKFIYALFDPRDPSVIRYVGATRNLTERIKVHNDPKSGLVENTAKVQWVKELQAAGLSIGWKLLETVPDSEGAKREAFWINEYRSPLLFNIVTGKTLLAIEKEKRTNKCAKREFNLTPIENPLTLADAERNHLIKIVNDCNGNKMLAAKVLGISRPTLYEKIHKHSLTK